MLALWSLMSTQVCGARKPRGDSQDYAGPERRRHRVYITRNSEYHFRDGFCVAVRDRRTGEFVQGHLALRRRLVGGLRFFPTGGLEASGEPRPGDSLYFATSAERELVTSPLERVERPSRELTMAYHSRGNRGERAAGSVSHQVA
jgi:hypothetical protein